jgi:Protein of unknown function (DUF2510)
VLHLSVGQWIVYGILAVFWAVLGYRLSESDRKRLGRTPWGLPSAVWAVFWFLSLLLGLVLYLIAHSGEVRRAQQNHAGVGDPAAGPTSSMDIRPSRSRTPSVAEQFPAYPQPANVHVEAAPPQVVAPTDRPTPPDHGLPGQPGEPDMRTSWPHSPPAWHPDPSGRFHFRWWDGYQWTSQVATDGHHLIDTNPDQRIGPY